MGDKPTTISQPTVENVHLAAPTASATNRLVMRTSWVHAPDGQPLKSWGKPHSVPLRSRESAFERWIDLGDTWTDLDLAWVAEPALVLVTNEGVGTVNVAANHDAGRVLICGLAPGRELPVPDPICGLSVRGPGRVRVVAVPK
jgi:hypothetical protein